MQVACLIPDDTVYHDMQRRLSDHRFVCSRFPTDIALLRGLTRDHADVALIDIGWAAAPEEQHFLSWLQCRGAGHVPIVTQIVDDRSDRVARLLEAGAADVVARGADTLELAARLQAAIRRHRGMLQPQMLRVCDFELNRAECRVRDRGVDLALTPREFGLAWVMFSHLGDCVTRRTISLMVWGVAADISNRTMEQHVHSLRKKLRLGNARGVVLRAVYGKGYQLSQLRREPAVESAAPRLGAHQVFGIVAPEPG